MHIDVCDLRDFYYRTGLGRAAQRAIRAQMLALWPEAKAQTVVGFGFAAPLLRPYLGQARRMVALMPGQQGVMHWPAGQPNISVLSDELWWPLQTGMADKLVMMHGLENCDNTPALLDEAARVLGPGGRALFIVPNRGGIWARSDQTPFGSGHPYTLGQLDALLTAHGFQSERHAVALFQPPSHRRFWLKSGPLWERVGQKLSNRYAGGVLLLEASRQLFRPRGTPATETQRIPLRVLEGVPQTARNAAPDRSAKPS
ncbi:MAG: class I SAM-dependent methyltransferase [Mangrovicoccus sp.]|nr:class I SAM-dependent methyltransferase [Mangrovicoccus sp.]